MFKWIRRLVILVVLLVVGGVVALYLSLGRIVKSVVQKEGTEQLHVTTTLSSASVGVTSGSIGFKDFALGSPAGFSAPAMLTVGGLTVDTAGVTHLRDKPLHVTTIQLDAPHLVIEQKGTTLNFKALMDGLPGKAPAGEAKPSPATADQNPLKLVIDTLNVNNATVEFIPDAAGTVNGVAGNALGALGDLGKQATAQADKQLAKQLKPMTITLPTMDVKNIGNADGKMQGAEVKDVVTAVIQAMVAKAVQDHNLPIPSALLQGNLASVKDKVSDTVQDEIKKQTGNLPGGAGKLLNGVLGGDKK